MYRVPSGPFYITYALTFLLCSADGVPDAALYTKGVLPFTGFGLNRCILKSACVRFPGTVPYACYLCSVVSCDGAWPVSLTPCRMPIIDYVGFWIERKDRMGVY